MNKSELIETLTKLTEMDDVNDLEPRTRELEQITSQMNQLLSNNV